MYPGVIRHGTNTVAFDFTIVCLANIHVLTRGPLRATRRFLNQSSIIDGPEQG